MRVCNLASGSSGNCTYIESKQAKILIDNGKPLAYVLNALNELGVAPDSIDAILITHEHSDHIKGIEKYSRSFSTPIYAHNEIKEIIKNQIHVDSELFNFYDSDFYIKDLYSNTRIKRRSNTISRFKEIFKRIYSYKRKRTTRGYYI